MQQSEDLVADFVIIDEPQRDAHSLRMELVDRIKLGKLKYERNRQLIQLVSSQKYECHRPHLIQMLVLTRLAQDSENLQDRKHQRRVAHQRRERRNQPVQISQRNLPSFVNPMGRQRQEHPQLARKLSW